MIVSCVFTLVLLQTLKNELSEGVDLIIRLFYTPPLPLSKLHSRNCFSSLLAHTCLPLLLIFLHPSSRWSTFNYLSSPIFPSAFEKHYSLLSNTSIVLGNPASWTLTNGGSATYALTRPSCPASFIALSMGLFPI